MLISVFRNYCFVMVFVIAFITKASGQEIVTPDTSIISIVSSDTTAKKDTSVAPVPIENTATQDTTNQIPVIDNSRVKRPYPKEVPQPDYTNYHPVKTIADNSTAEKLTDNALPAEFLSIDTDTDGKISTKELFATIDNFFEGQSTFTVPQIHKLIDFFFEQ